MVAQNGQTKHFCSSSGQHRRAWVDRKTRWKAFAQQVHFHIISIMFTRRLKSGMTGSGEMWSYLYSVVPVQLTAYQTGPPTSWNTPESSFHQQVELFCSSMLVSYKHKLIRLHSRGKMGKRKVFRTTHTICGAHFQPRVHTLLCLNASLWNVYCNDVMVV